MKDIYLEIRKANEIKYGTEIGNIGPKIFEEIYSDRTHFIYELLQNSEDACSKIKSHQKDFKVIFKLFDDRLEVINNGALFDDADVEGVCGITKSTKSKDNSQIGKFGIGFKSVYSYTNSPEVHSGNKSFCIKDYVHPYNIEKRDSLLPDQTLIVIPFTHEQISSQESFNEIKERLLNLEETTLLFLKNLSQIDLVINDKNIGSYRKIIDKDKNNLKYIKLVKKVANSENITNWINLSKEVFIMNNSFNIELAYNFVKKDEKIVFTPVLNSRVSVTFPTEKNTFLDFIIQAPFDTDTARGDIKQNNSKNNALLEEISKFVAESISIIKKENLLDISFLNILPIDISYNQSTYLIYKSIYNYVLKELSSDESFLPTQDGTFINKNNSVISGTKKLSNLIDNNQLNQIFDKKDLKWLSSDISNKNDHYRKIYLYLTHNKLFFEQLNIEEFFSLINHQFLEKQTDSWMIKFYTFLNQTINFTDNLYDINILKKDIIRLENDELVTPYNSQNKVNCYIPKENSKSNNEYKFVKKVFLKDSNSIQFFNRLGFKEPDLLSEIKEYILPKYVNRNNVDSEYKRDFDKIFNYYIKTKDPNIILDLKNLNIILTSQNILEKPSETYLLNNDLKIYFDDKKDNFVNIDFYSDIYNNIEILNQFFLLLGVNTSPKIIKKNITLSEKEISEIIGNSAFTRAESIQDKTIEGLEEFISRISSKEESFILWNIVLDVYKKNIWCFEGEFIWFGRNRSPNKNTFPSTISKLLNNNPWLYKKDDEKIYKPCEIKFEELDVKYRLINYMPTFLDGLKDNLLFKKEIDTTGLSEELKKKLEISDIFSKFLEKFSENEIIKILAEKSDEKKDISNWMPEFEAEKSKIEVIKADLKPRIKKDKKSTNNENISNTSEFDGLSSEEKKKIGNWGEQCVIKYLKEKYISSYINSKIVDTQLGFNVLVDKEIKVEVFWLNKHEDTGIGHDIKIIENNIIKYIEVKSTKTDTIDNFELSERQWELAQEQGDNYIIYRVLNVGKFNPKIVDNIINPYKLWLDGLLKVKSIKISL